MKMLQIMAASLLGTAQENGIPNNPLDEKSINSIVDLVGFVAGIIAVIVVVVAGINYSLSAGDPQKTAKAKNTIIYAVIALVIISAAFAITKFVLGRI